KDHLYEWCQKGYDFIAAPLPNHSYYNYPIIKQFLRLKLNSKTDKYQGYSLYNNLHKGGFSLRKVSSFIAVCEDYAKDCHEEKGNTEKEKYANNLSGNPTNNLKYPTVEEALDFAFARNPSFCFSAIGKRLPMACDRPNHKRRISFWKMFIPCLGKA
ncbi:MAG: DUF5672 family protein, partial [Prevotellaceae bacterium]|nr:DUF5672 family protein [Prevotellaceae bacterium]